MKREEKSVATASAKAKAKAVKTHDRVKTKEVWEAAQARAVAAKRHEEGMQEFVKNVTQRVEERRATKRDGPVTARPDWRGQTTHR